ncbi:unnamed protein product [Lampetra planeri]
MESHRVQLMGDPHPGERGAGWLGGENRGWRAGRSVASPLVRPNEAARRVGGRLGAAWRWKSTAECSRRNRPRQGKVEELGTGGQ